MKKIMDRLAHSQWRGGSRFTNILKFISANGPIVPLTVYLIKGYQMFLSPWLGTRCRFYPSCSNFAMEAIEKQGMFVGMLNTSKRLAKCHPFHTGGYDPVSTVERASRIIPVFMYLFAYKAASAAFLGITLLSLESK